MKVLPFGSADEQQDALPAVCQHLERGGLLAYPTETVYGLGCLLQPEAVRQLASLKGDRAEKAFLLLVDDRSRISGLQWTEAARCLADTFWPGPLTLALKYHEADFPPEVVGPGNTIAVRETGHGGMRLLLRELATPITSTSANLPGQAPALDAEATRALLQALDTSASFLLLDGGKLAPSAPSTVVDCSEAIPRLLRAGAISTDLLKRCVHELRT